MAPGEDDLQGTGMGVETGSQTHPPAPAQPAPPPQPSQTPAQQMAQAAGMGQTAPPAQEYQPLHEALKGYGINLPQGVEGHAALQYIVTQLAQARQLQELAPYGQQYLQHADKFQSWLAQQQAAEKAAQAKSWWQPPEWNSDWRNKIQYDAQTGEIKPAPGTDPSVVQRYLHAMEFRQKFMDDFTTDPIKAIRPGLEEVIRETAQQLIQEQFGQYQSHQQSLGFLDQHKDWIYARDASGRVVMGQAGRPELSPLGNRFVEHLRAAHSMGIQEEQQRHNYALRCTQNDLLMAERQRAAQQQAAAPQQTPQQAAQENFLGRAGGAAARRPSAAGSTTGGDTAPPQNGSLSLAEMMRQRAREVGITDEVVNGTLTGR